jgi:hypothetical protein
MYSGDNPLQRSHLEREREKEMDRDEVGLFGDAQTVIILAFVHGRFHSIRKRSDYFLVFK